MLCEFAGTFVASPTCACRAQAFLLTSVFPSDRGNVFRLVGIVHPAECGIGNGNAPPLLHIFIEALDIFQLLLSVKSMCCPLSKSAILYVVPYLPLLPFLRPFLTTSPHSQPPRHIQSICAARIRQPPEYGGAAVQHLASFKALERTIFLSVRYEAYCNLNKKGLLCNRKRTARRWKAPSPSLRQLLLTCYGVRACLPTTCPTMARPQHQRGPRKSGRGTMKHLRYPHCQEP